MDEYECLIKMTMVWGYLSLHPGKEKHDAYNYLGMDEDLCGCPCCEYCRNGISDLPDCTKCPLADFWPLKAADIEQYPVVTPCVYDSSEYLNWYHANVYEVRMIAARKILEASFRAMGALNFKRNYGGSND